MPNLVDELTRVIAGQELQPHQLEVEIAETSLQYNLEDGVKQLEKLQALGVRIALDDFGANACSLRMLRDLPIDTLKLDRQLIAPLPGSTTDAAMVRCVIELCREYRITVVAEGVETTEQADWLRANGCDYVQGFLLAHPLTEGDASEFPRFFDWQQV